MYPKLKVRSQEQDVRYGGRNNPSLAGLKALHSLFHGDLDFHAKKETKPASKTLEAEESSPCNMPSITPLSATNSDKNDRGEEDTRPNIYASPIPRPRAVLSSPINDDMIGSQIKKRTEDRTSPLKPHQSGHKCDVTTKKSASGNEVSKKATNKSEVHKARIPYGPKSNVSLRHSAAERHRSGREASEDTLNKRDNRACKGSVPPAIRIKK